MSGGASEVPGPGEVTPSGGGARKRDSLGTAGSAAQLIIKGTRGPARSCRRRALWCEGVACVRAPRLRPSASLASERLADARRAGSVRVRPSAADTARPSTVSEDVKHRDRNFALSTQEKRGLREMRVLENLKNMIQETNDQVLPRCRDTMELGLSPVLQTRKAAGRSVLPAVEVRAAQPHQAVPSLDWQRPGQRAVVYGDEGRASGALRMNVMVGSLWKPPEKFEPDGGDQDNPKTGAQGQCKSPPRLPAACSRGSGTGESSGKWRKRVLMCSCDQTAGHAADLFLWPSKLWCRLVAVTYTEIATVACCQEITLPLSPAWQNNCLGNVCDFQILFSQIVNNHLIASEKQQRVQWEEFMTQQRGRQAAVDEEHSRALGRLREQYAQMEKDLAKFSTF
ncbi:Biogenesis of lysosome-related organelles complex 1 subunit 5 [Galemys pyrenaicus]|uniref:Biogenesis of lysosome-related organelles complex 1 subunit 5 n=1 Tax=Galemys pyrenaicus TaxID=202257 RepID=A0A8J6A059_GALPY|nr:Biogenesis of lysosome-related organelles complex 1 subunit 5 [Galemys pyrenaicus]